MDTGRQRPSEDLILGLLVKQADGSGWPASSIAVSYGDETFAMVEPAPPEGSTIWRTTRRAGEVEVMTERLLNDCTIV